MEDLHAGELRALQQGLQGALPIAALVMGNLVLPAPQGRKRGHRDQDMAAGLQNSVDFLQSAAVSVCSASGCVVPRTSVVTGFCVRSP